MSRNLALLTIGIVTLSGFCGCATKSDPRATDAPSQSTEVPAEVSRIAALVRASLAKDHGDFPAALREAENLLSLNPTDVAALRLRSSVRVGLKQFEPAVADAKRVSELEPTGANAAHLAWTLLKAGRPAEAIAAAEEGLTLSSNDRVRSQLHLMKASAGVRLKQWQSVLIETEDALALNPDEAGAHLQRAIAYNWTGDPAAALPHAEYAVLHLPHDPVTFETRGNTYFLLERIDEALADLDRAMSLPRDVAMPDRRRIVDTWTVLYAELETKKADRHGATGTVADYTRMIGLLEARQIKPWSLYLSRGEAKLSVGDRAGAIADFTAAIAIDPKFEIGYANRGRTYEDEGRYADAIKDYEAAVRLNGRSTWALRQLGVCCGRAGEWKKAADAFEKVAAIDPDPGSYDVLFATVARLRSGAPHATELLRQQLPTRPNGWGKFVAQFLAGEIDEPTLLARAAEGLSPDKIRDQTCEACFYAAERRLVHGDTGGASTLFARCVATRQTTFTEWIWATGELQRLHPSNSPPP